MTIQFSAVIPAHNRAKLLPETLESILCQSARAAEIVVVDDGSTDDTAEVLAGYGDKVRCVRIDNAGPPGARDAGARLCRSDWIAFCDSDDVWLPNHLSELHRLASITNVPFVFSNCRHFDDEGWEATDKFAQAPAGYWSSVRRLDPCSGVVRGCMLEDYLRFQPILASCLAVRRDFYGQVGGYDPAVGHAGSEDQDFVLRCIMGGSPGVLFTPTVGIRRHRANRSANQVRRSLGYVGILMRFKEKETLSPRQAACVDERIRLGAIGGIDAAFSAGDLAAVRTLAQHVPVRNRRLKTQLKIAIAALPRAVAAPLSRLLARSGEISPAGRHDQADQRG